MTITGVKKNVLLLAILCCGSILRAQEEPAVQHCIQVFFQGFAKGDTSLMSTVMDRNMTLQTVVDKPNESLKIVSETRKEFLTTIAGLSNQKLDERIISWNIHVDGAYADAWCKYQLFVDTTFYHWGTDNFQLVKDQGRWRILSITDTRRKKEWFVSNAEQHNQAGKNINTLMDNWHKAAAKGDEKIFFGSMDSASIYLGTDKTEHWTKQDFEAWSKKYFEQDKAWDFTPHDRQIYFSENMDYAWFDELLDTWMGVCRGSGVLQYKNGQWKLRQYNLAVTVPNEKMKEFVKINQK